MDWGFWIGDFGWKIQANPISNIQYPISNYIYLVGKNRGEWIKKGA